MYIPGNSVGKSVVHVRTFYLYFQEKKLALQHRSMYIVATTFFGEIKCNKREIKFANLLL